MLTVEGENSTREENHGKQTTGVDDDTTRLGNDETQDTVNQTSRPATLGKDDHPWEDLMLRKTENVLENFSPDLVEHKLQQLEDDNRIGEHPEGRMVSFIYFNERIYWYRATMSVFPIDRINP